MPFLGKQPTAGFASIVKDDLTPNGSTTAFTLSKQVANANDIAVFLGNVRQEPTDAYTVSGTTLTMSAAPASGLNFYVLHIAGTTESSVVPADNTISTAKIQSSAVTDAKIASGITATKIYPNKIRASDLDTTTQGSGIMMWEHIETKIAQSDGDNNVQTLNGANECINFDVRTVKHLYSEYWIKFHWMAPVTNLETADILMDTLQGDGSTFTGTSTWFGAGTIMYESTLSTALTRSGSTTAKFVQNVWPMSKTNNFHAGCVGDVYCKGFMPEVTQNIGGASAVNDYHGGEYRTYYESRFHTYDDSSIDKYTGAIVMIRQNQNFDSDNTTGANSFGGFSFRWNSNNIDFAKGTAVSIYGLRVPTAD